MDPAVAVPLQFTIDAAVLCAAALVLIWAAVDRDRLAIAGAVALAFAQSVHTAQLITPEDSLWVLWGVVRIAGVIAIVIRTWRAEERVLVTGGAVAVALGAVWQTATDAGVVELDLLPRLLLAGGAVVLIVWVWHRSRASVRVRMVASFVLVVGIAMVVAGGAVLRVSVADARIAASNELADTALGQRSTFAETTDGLLRKGAIGSALLTASADPKSAVVELRRRTLTDVSFVILVLRDGSAHGVHDLGTADTVAVIGSDAVDAAHAGQASTGVFRLTGGAALTAAAPVYSSANGGATTGVLVLGELVDARDVRAFASRLDPDATAQLVADDGSQIVSSDGAFVEDIEALRNGEADIDGERVLVASAPLIVSSGPGAHIVLTRPVRSVVASAASVPRALVGGLLAAALLAVIVATWVSSRLTRPVLDAVEGAERAKSQFLSTVSHELRTPLTPIRGYADLLRRERVPRRRAEVYLDEIDEATRRLERIVMLLVEVAALEAGRYSPDKKRVAPSELISEVVRSRRGKERKHRVLTEVQKPLPELDVDRIAITTVLDELVDNAIKFSPSGGAVHVRARSVGDAVELSVEDEGIGLEPDRVKELSTSFSQAEPGETRRFGGLGLGLTYSNGVLAAHGSQLEVSANPAKGSTFSFTLPAVKEVAERKAARATGKVRRTKI